MTFPEPILCSHASSPRGSIRDSATAKISRAGNPPVSLSGRRTSLRQREKTSRPLLSSALRGRARRLEAVTAIDVNVGDAHVAAFLWPGTGVPFPRARALSGIGLRGDAIRRRTRARGVGGTAVGLTGSSTVSSTIGSAAVPLRRRIRLRRVIRWRGVIGWRRAVGWRSRGTILCIRPRHPGGRSQNAHSCDCDESAFHRLPPFG
jgi:hypothetical protein